MVMANLIKRNQFPPKDEFISFYSTLSQRGLASHYQCNEKRIHGWVKHFGLTLRPRGGGNNRKYNIQKDSLSTLIATGKTNHEIASILGMSISALSVWIMKLGLQRVYDTTSYYGYKREVIRLTNHIWRKSEHLINPLGFKRTRHGVSGGYQLDHIIPIKHGFYNSIDAAIIAGEKNLQMLPWRDNLRKGGVYHG